MKMIFVAALLAGMSTSAFAAGTIECQNDDSSIVVTGADTGFKATFSSAKLYGTELLKNGSSSVVDEVYNSDRTFDLKIVDSKSGFEILNLETIKVADTITGRGFVSSGLAFISGGKDVRPVNCKFIF